MGFVQAGLIITNNHNGSTDNLTLGELSARVARPFGRDSYYIQMGMEAVERALIRLSKHLWPHELVSANYTIVNADDTYQLPKAAKAVVSVTVNDGTDTVGSYTYVLPELWERVKRSGGSNIYTIKNMTRTGEVTLYPVPDSALAGKTLRVDYYERVVAPASPDHRINVPYAFQDVIWAWARYFLAQTHRNSNPSIMAEARSDAFTAQAEYIGTLGQNAVDPDHARWLP